MKIEEVNSKKMTLTCKHCKKKFERYRVKVLNPLSSYCSQECKFEGQRTKIAVPCKNCGKDAYKYISQIKNASNVFCDQKCKGEWQHKSALFKVTCFVCGKDFEKTRSYFKRLSSNPTCSVECGHIARAKRFDRTKAFVLLSNGTPIGDAVKALGLANTEANRTNVYEAAREVGNEIKDVNTSLVKKEIKPEYNPTQKRNEMEILGKFSLRREWRLPQIPTFEEKVFDKAAYFFLTKTTPIYNNMRDIYYSKVTVTYTKNKRTLTETHNVVCTGKDLKEAQSYEDTWKNLLHRVESLRKNATVIAIEPINKIGTTNY